MEMGDCIPDLAGLLQPRFNNNVEVVRYTATKCTTAGQNFGSLMLQLDVKVKSAAEDDERLNLVAKLRPPNKWLNDTFRTHLTFKKEVEMYRDVLPALKSFQRDQGVTEVIDFFPEYYGGRISLNTQSEVADDDAVVLLENLTNKGFIIGDKMKGFDLQTAEVLIKDLAVFHAIPVAIKMLRPQAFRKLLPHLAPIEVYGNVSVKMQEDMIDFIMATAADDPECLELISTVRNTCKDNMHYLTNRPMPSEPLATIIHNDYWVNNIMLKFNGNKLQATKMIDFQYVSYGSPADDILVFLLISLQEELLSLHYDDLVSLYHNTFVDTLASLKCSTEEFTYESLQEEISTTAKTQFLNLLIKLRPIFGFADIGKDITEYSDEDFVPDKPTEQYFRKFREIILYFAKKKWLRN